MSLSGGFYFVTIHLGGIIKIWDVRSPSFGSSALEPGAELENSDVDHHLVATYCVNAAVSDVSYCTTGDTGTRVILGLLLSSQNYGTNKLKAIEFELPRSAREIQLQDHVESPGVVGLYTGTLHVQDGLVAAFGTMSPQQALHINVYGYRQNLMWVINPELEGFDGPVSLFSDSLRMAQDDEQY
ncbi:hypothetical protein FS837_001040 [Tulasnella sp. UAMH 9824]|nr:hypothetical protein FS837_001040 [Tulasnella sp. UAMH 9824]